MPVDSTQNPEDRRLDSWKEVAAFFGRDERTVKRWEKERGLPIHRVPGRGRGSIFAYAAELAAWLRSAQLKEPSESAARNAAPVVTSSEPVLEAPVGQGTWRKAGILSGIGFLLLMTLGFTHFYQLHSVQGHLLPSVSVRTDSESHKKAEELYFQGRYHWNKRTPEDLTVAVDDFAKSAQLDPNYALAYAGTADCYNLLREYTSAPGSQTFPLAISAARKSIELDPNLSAGHRALAFALFHWNWDISGGEREFKKAIELNPNDAEAHHWYATALMSLSRYADATQEIERARQLDPASSSIAADRALLLYTSGHKDEGFSLLKELKIADPKFSSPPNYLARMYFQEREYEKYFDEAEDAARLSHDDHALAALASAQKRYQNEGEQAFLQGELELALQAFKQGRTDAYSVAVLYAAMGKRQSALDYLEKAYRRHEYILISLGNLEPFRSFHDDPQFQDLLNRVYNHSSSPV